MSICTNCGTAVPDSAKFCTICGKTAVKTTGSSKMSPTCDVTAEPKRQSFVKLCSNYFSSARDLGTSVWSQFRTYDRKTQAILAVTAIAVLIGLLSTVKSQFSSEAAWKNKMAHAHKLYEAGRLNEASDAMKEALSIVEKTKTPEDLEVRERVVSTLVALWMTERNRGVRGWELYQHQERAEALVNSMLKQKIGNVAQANAVWNSARAVAGIYVMNNQQFLAQRILQRADSIAREYNLYRK